MNLKFWKKNPAGEDSADSLREKPGDGDVSRKSPDRGRHDPAPSGVKQQESGVSVALPKRRLLIFAAIGLPIVAVLSLIIWKISGPSPDQNSATAGMPGSNQASAVSENQPVKLHPSEYMQLGIVKSKDRKADLEALKKKNEELLLQIEALEVVPSQVDSARSARRQAEIAALKKNNDELQAQIGALKAELPKIEKSQAEQNQENIDALTKQNKELQAQISALKAELPKIEKSQVVQNQTKIDALTKRNKELQVQIETIRKRQQQLSSASPAGQAQGKRPPPVAGGNIAIGSKDPKATSMSLKQAIEAMNVGPDVPPKNVK